MFMKKIYVTNHLFLCSLQDIFLNAFACDKSVDVHNFLLADSMSSTHCLEKNTLILSKTIISCFSLPLRSP